MAGTKFISTSNLPAPRRSVHPPSCFATNGKHVYRSQWPDGEADVPPRVDFLWAGGMLAHARAQRRAVNGWVGRRTGGVRPSSSGAWRAVMSSRSPPWLFEGNLLMGNQSSKLITGTVIKRASPSPLLPTPQPHPHKTRFGRRPHEKPPPSVCHLRRRAEDSVCLLWTTHNLAAGESLLTNLWLRQQRCQTVNAELIRLWGWCYCWTSTTPL